MRCPSDTRACRGPTLRLTKALLTVAGVAAAAFLVGCENAFEGISVRDWEEVGKAVEPQSALRGEFVVTTLQPGQGRIARAGDLVKAEILVTTPPQYASHRPRQPVPQVVAWIWLGREPLSSDSHQRFVEVETFGDLGEARVRKAFIGRQLHERFSIQMPPGSTRGTDAVPLGGIIAQTDAKLRGIAYIDNRPVLSRDWPGLRLSVEGEDFSSAEIRILAICDARLFRRTATLRQKGFIFPMGERTYDFAREGTLGWTAIDAECPAPDGHVRFEAGPFYHQPLVSERKRLADWSGSYRRVRPPERFPQEWRPAK